MKEGHLNLKYAALVVAAIGGCMLFVAGIAFGFWFAQNFQIVPRGDFNKMIADAMQSGAEGKPGGETQNALNSIVAQVLKQQGVSEGLSGSAPPVASRGASQGAFAFKFTPGEKLHYTLSAQMKGQGLEGVMPDPIALNLDSGFDLETQAVDASGNADLQMTYGGMRMNGDFMGSTLRMEQGPTGSRMVIGAQGPNASGSPRETAMDLPVLNALMTPTKMRVAPNGAVLRMSGAPGMDSMIDPMPLLTSIEFPAPHMTPGTQWESAADMPIPGFGSSIRTRIVNTFTGYKTIGRRLCAVIDQEVSTDPGSSLLPSSANALGAVVGFAMPKLDLKGKNKVYFDTDNGQLVHSEMDLGMHLDIGKPLEGLGAGLKGLLGDLPEFQGGQPKQQAKPQGNPLNLDVNVNATVSLTDPVSPPAPAQPQ